MIDYDLEGRVVVGPSAQPPTLIVPPTDILPPAILVSPAVLQRARELLALTATAPSIVRDQGEGVDEAGTRPRGSSLADRLCARRPGAVRVVGVALVAVLSGGRRIHARRR